MHVLRIPVQSMLVLLVQDQDLQLFKLLQDQVLQVFVLLQDLVLEAVQEVVEVVHALVAEEDK